MSIAKHTLKSNTMYKPIASREFPGWYEIPGFSGYCANEKGYVLNKKTKNFSVGGKAGRYLKVSAYEDGKPRASLYYIHVLVARAFYGIAPEGDFVVMHKNNNRADNRPSNLSYGTQSENILQVYKDGLKYSKRYHLSKESLFRDWESTESLVSLEEYQYVSVNSSTIRTIGYDKAKKELEIVFKSGGTYLYSPVSEKRFLNTVHSQSVGAYFAKHIKNHYAYLKV